MLALAQVDTSREAHEMWVYAEARLVVLEEFLAAGRASEAEIENQRQLFRVAHEKRATVLNHRPRRGAT